LRQRNIPSSGHLSVRLPLSFDGRKIYCYKPGALNIFPNQDLHAETGWSVELGSGRDSGCADEWLFDLAGFWTQYQDMMEFTFGIYKPDSVTYPTLEHIGFKSLNTGNARISGLDISVTNQGKAGQFSFDFFGGYTYMDPVDLSLIQQSGHAEISLHHSVKADFAAEWHHFSSD